MNEPTHEPERLQLSLEEVTALIEPGPAAVVSDEGEGVYEVTWGRLADATEGVRTLEASPDRIGVLMAFKPQPGGESIAVRFYVKPQAVATDR
jgi:hypothetical protein